MRSITKNESEKPGENAAVMFVFIIVASIVSKLEKNTSWISTS
jgi:hypothetical protein